MEQTDAAVLVYRYGEQGFERETYTGLAAVIQLPEIGCSLAVAELYEGIELSTSTSTTADVGSLHSKEVDLVMRSHLRFSLKQLLVITAIAAVVFAFGMRPTVIPTATLDALRAANRSSELVVGEDAAGRLRTFGSVTIPVGQAMPASAGALPLCTFTIDGKAHHFRHDLPSGFEYRIYLVKTLDAGEYKWVAFRRK